MNKHWDIDNIRFMTIGPKPKQPQEICTLSCGDRTIVSEIGVKDAAFIVRAVNTYQDLIDTLHYVVDSGESFERVQEIAAQAITRTEEK